MTKLHFRRRSGSLFFMFGLTVFAIASFSFGNLMLNQKNKIEEENIEKKN